MHRNNYVGKVVIFFLSISFIRNTESFKSAVLQRPAHVRLQYNHGSNERVRSTLKSTSNNGLSDEVIAEQEEKFKIVTCMSTACSRKRAALGMDNLCTFGAMYSRASASRVQVEEGPCIGSCKKAPCVTIEHEDFFGSVALEGMTADEFASDAYVLAEELYFT